MPTAFVEIRATRAARSLGPCVPADDFAFRVHSVFRSALNLQPAGGGALVTLVGADADDLPHGIRLATHEAFDAWPVAVGARGRRTGDALVFGAAADGTAWRVGLAGAVRRARPRLPRLAPASVATRAAWRDCATWLAAEQARVAADLRLSSLVGGAPAGTALGARLAAAAGELGEAVQRADAAAADRAAARLLGLGLGLTPAGDDLLCGLLAALACTSTPGDPTGRFRRAWGEALSRRLGATNAIAATYLAAAIEDCFTGALAGFAAALGEHAKNETGDGPRTALRRLCATGHSSGMDAATGFLFGLRLRGDRETRRYAA